MSGPVTPKSSSHWYDPVTGNPKYEVPYADPKKGKRKTNKGDARKLGLLPSVTTILKIAPKPFLFAWQMNQTIDACISVSEAKGAALSRDDYAEIMAEADAISREAREKGKEIHKAVEQLMLDWSLGRQFYSQAIHNKDLEMLKRIINKYSLEPRYLERSFASRKYGYGGRLDFEGVGTLRGDGIRRSCILDYKSQNTKGEGKFTVYKEVPCQLAAYAYGVGKPAADLGTIYFDTSIPGNVQLIYHEDNDYWFYAFLEVFRVWKGPLGENFEV